MELLEIYADVFFNQHFQARIRPNGCQKAAQSDRAGLTRLKWANLPNEGVLRLGGQTRRGFFIYRRCTNSSAKLPNEGMLHLGGGGGRKKQSDMSFSDFSTRV
jgi:hypothetical protein